MRQSCFEDPNPDGWGRHFLAEAKGWPTPEQCRPRPDLLWSDTDAPADPHRQEAAGFLVVECQRAGQWVGVSWARLAVSVLAAEDPDRYAACVRHWRMRHAFLRGLYASAVPFPGDIQPILPPHSGGQLTPLRQNHWAGFRLQRVADGLNELVMNGSVARSDAREASTVLFPTQRLVRLLSRYRFTLIESPGVSSA